MPSNEVCQHCSQSVRAGEAVFREGYSYHRRCRKCYVCSETNLHAAEVFRGVIFCASCAKRIFRGCSTARQSKQPPRGERQHHRRRRTVEHGIIERARAARSVSSSLDTSKTETAVPGDPRISQDCYCVSDVVTQARRLINFIYFQTRFDKNDTADIAQCTEACQRMLEDLECPIPEPKPQGSTTTTQQQQQEQQQLIKLIRNSMPMKINSAEVGTTHSHSRFHSKRKGKKRKKMKQESLQCSDLRIAELGASVEIATMALRKTSTKKVQSELKITEKVEEPETISMFSNIDSVISHTSDEEYLDSECQDYRGSKEFNKCIWEHIFRSLVKIPCKFFKKNILQRSSLISVIVGINDEEDYKSAFGRLKRLFHDDVLDHQHNGYKKLYSTINKKKTPYKLGWLEADVPGDRKTCPCKHFHQCHSYRCMRQQVMRLAGPTESKMYVFRTRLKKLVMPPFLKNLSFQYNTPALVKPVSIKSDSRSSHASHGSTQSKTKKCLEERTSRLNIALNLN